MIKSLSCFVLVLICASTGFTQNTVGLLTIDETQISSGYNLFYPHHQTTVWLTDNCGRVVNSWADFTYNPGNTAYLLDNGNLLKTGSEGASANPVFSAGGAGEVLRIKDWNNTLLWHFKYSDSTHRLHHDIAPLPNGNILAVVWELKNKTQSIAAGRDTTKLPDDELWPDYIIEVQPIFPDSFEIVWEWHAWDHLIQDVDPLQSNYGVIADHPELIDINGGSTPSADWMHVNSIDYNEDLDQIVISVPRFDEFWIIDHSTTTAEAASHSGGMYGKGGDLLYRWGNPAAYNRGDTSDQRLFFQHDVHWIDLGLDPGHPDYGKILLYNNQHPGDWSSVDVINLPVDGAGFYTDPLPGMGYAPDTAQWTYGTPADPFFSAGLSGAQRLPNGNTLVCVAAEGRVFEINPAGERIWEYENPMVGGGAWVNGDPVTGSNLLFRMNRYAPDHPAIAGRDLTAGNYIEFNPDTALCPLSITGISSMQSMDDARVYPNPAADFSLLELTPAFSGRLTVRLQDLSGQTKYTQFFDVRKGERFSTFIDLSELAAAVYFLHLTSPDQQQTLKLIVH